MQKLPQGSERTLLLSVYGLMAFLVFLAATAVTWIISTEFHSGSPLKRKRKPGTEAHNIFTNGALDSQSIPRATSAPR